MADELIDIFDKNNQHIGTAMKHQAHKEGLWHRGAHVWIYNKKGEILLQLRVKTKANYPGVWDLSAAGHIAAGEDTNTGALRELEEEVGIKAKKLDLFTINSISTKLDYIYDQEFHYIYLLEWNGNPDNLNLQEEEVEKVKFFSSDEIEKALQEKDPRFLGTTTQAHINYWNSILEEVKKRTS